ncbi:MAG: hypothetical protein AAF721_13545 [Myxococcota bacterium]
MSEGSLAERIAIAASHVDTMYAAGVPAVARVEGPLFECGEVMAWIARAHAVEHEQTALKKMGALRASWGVPSHADDEGPPVDPGRSAEVYTRGGMLLDAHPHLPRAGEGFASWAARVREAIGAPFGMQAPGIECASWSAAHRLQALLAPVLRATGPRTYRYNAFLGDYRRTPFGFHIDPHQEAVVQYVIEGSRRASFWDGLSLTPSDAAWVEDTRGDTEPARAPDVAFDLQPGDLVFWPGTAVHGMEASGPSIALSMVVDRASPRSRAQVISTLETMTCAGAMALPAVTAPASVGPSDTLRRQAVFPLRYERIDDTLIIGVCGRTFDWPDFASVPAAMRLVDALNEAPRVEVAAVVARCEEPALPADLIYEVIGMLCGLGFFSVAGG